MKRRNKPSVIIVTGKVSTIRIGFTMSLKRPKTIATIIADT